MPKTMIFLNRWNTLYHLMLTQVEGDESRQQPGAVSGLA
jgi:hypothetical protein